MNANEAKCFIYLFQVLRLLKRVLEFDLLVHSDPVQKFVAQHNLHIIPPIKIVEGCEDPGCQGCWIIHLATSRAAQFFIILQFTYKYTSIRRKTNSITLYFDMCVLYGCVTPSLTSLDKSRWSKAMIPRIMWNWVASGASIEVFKDWKWLENLLWYHVKFRKVIRSSG